MSLDIGCFRPIFEHQPHLFTHPFLSSSGLFSDQLTSVMVDWDIFVWIKRSNQRQQVPGLIEDSCTSNDIADELEMYIGQAPRSMRDMKERDGEGHKT